MLIPLNFPTTQIAAQVAQFIEPTQPGGQNSLDNVVATVARSGTGAPGSTVEFIG